MQGKTESGFAFNISEEELDDWELVELLSDVEENPLSIVKIAKRILGEEQYIKLKEHCRDEHGRISVESMNDEITEILKSGTVKN